MTQPLRIVVAGASGRMGRAILRAILESEGFVLSSALEARGHADLGHEADALAGLRPGNVLVTDDPEIALATIDAVIDFTTPSASVQLAELAAKRHVVHVIGTTGFSCEQEAAIRAAASKTVIVKSGNMSLGVTLLAALVRQAAKALLDFDIEILEMHHRMKVDAPSGTALLLGDAAAEGRGVALDDVAVRDGHTGQRKPSSIGFASLRGGTVVGEHQVILAGPGERLVLSHVAEDRLIFARGALAGARWGQGKPAGLYSMADVLGLAR